MIESIHIEKFRGKNNLDIPNIGKANLIVGEDSKDKTILLEDIQQIAGGTHSIIAIDGIGEAEHHSTQDTTWSTLLAYAQKFGIQVFATTNSRDTVESFAKLIVADKTIDGVLIRLGRSAKTSNKGDIIATVMDADALSDAIAAGIEVR